MFTSYYRHMFFKWYRLLYHLSISFGSSAQLYTRLYNEFRKNSSLYIHRVVQYHRVQYPGIIAQYLSFWIVHPWITLLFFLTKTPERSTHANQICNIIPEERYHCEDERNLFFFVISNVGSDLQKDTQKCTQFPLWNTRFAEWIAAKIRSRFNISERPW